MNPGILDNGQRISVVGTTGSGKTTLARQLAQQLAIPHVELDALHWQSNWTPVSVDVFRDRTFIPETGVCPPQSRTFTLTQSNRRLAD